MWCSRSNPWPSQTWCHLPNDPKKEKLETKTLNIKKNIPMDAMWCSRSNRWPSEPSRVPYSPQGFPYSRGFLRNLPFRKVLSSYEEECWSFWLQILSRGKCESTLAGVLRKKTITQVQTTMLAHQRHILNIKFIVPGKSHNRHCTPIVTNMCVCVCCVATMRWRFETKSANCLSATPVFSQCDCSSKTIFNLQFVIHTLSPLRWKSEISVLGDGAIFGRRGDD